MKTSENIEQLATALSIAQGMMEPADMDGNSHHGKYATLLSIRESSRSALSKNDLSLIQAPFFIEGRVGIITRLMHKSGQWIETEISLKILKDDPHCIGSAITYGKRYSMSAMLGIVSDVDDDAAAAMQPRPPQKQPQARQSNTQQRLQPQQQQQQPETRLNVFDPSDAAMVDRVSKVLIQNGIEHLSQEFWDEIKGKSASFQTINEAIAKLKG